MGLSERFFFTPQRHDEDDLKINRDSFFKCFRTYHKSARGKSLTQGQVDGLNFLLDQIESDILPLPQVSYVLSTTAHETAWTFKPIGERGARAYFNKYEFRKDLGNTEKGDGYKYRGRGFSQLTGRRNYTLFTKLVGADLVNNPEGALEPATAYKIMREGMIRGLFTGAKLGAFVNSRQTDYVNARKTVNGLDQAKHIAGIAQNIEKCLRASTVADGGEIGVSDTGAGMTEGQSVPDSTSPKTEDSTVETPAVKVPQAEPPPTQPPVVTGVGTQWAALYTAISAPLAALGAWVAGARTEIVYGVAIVTAVIGTTYMILRYKKRKDADDRLSAEKMERERQAHEITLLQMRSAMSKRDNTVVVSPRPLESSDSQ